jgi:hypothetical protein
LKPQYYKKKKKKLSQTNLHPKSNPPQKQTNKKNQKAKKTVSHITKENKCETSFFHIECILKVCLFKTAGL